MKQLRVSTQTPLMVQTKRMQSTRLKTHTVLPLKPETRAKVNSPKVQKTLVQLTKPNAAHCKMDTSKGKAKVETAPLLKSYPILRLPQRLNQERRKLEQARLTLLLSETREVSRTLQLWSVNTSCYSTASRRLTSSRRRILWPTARLCVLNGPPLAASLLSQKRLARSILAVPTASFPEPRTSPSRDQHGRPPQDSVI